MRRAALVLTVAAAACLGPRPDPSTFYVLSAGPAPVAAIRPLTVTLGLGPVSIPAYLNRSEFVTRLSENELALSPTARWAEPLEENVRRVLRSNLNQLLRPDAIVVYPWYASANVVYGISIEFTRLEADSTGAVSIEAEWAITSGDRQETLYRDQTSQSEPGGGPTTEASVAALSRAITKLSEEIAEELRRVDGSGSG